MKNRGRIKFLSKKKDKTVKKLSEIRKKNFRNGNCVFTLAAEPNFSLNRIGRDRARILSVILAKGEIFIT